uniref:Momilactone A synthase n=1 Tax=Aegilops tauschii TaxID=37682 RepID=M8CMY2_AEGTA
MASPRLRTLRGLSTSSFQSLNAAGTLRCCAQDMEFECLIIFCVMICCRYGWYRLAGKVAVITGAASGIGKATAMEFIRNGAKIIIADVQDDLGRSVAAELGPDAAYVRCDVSDEAQIAAAVDLAVERHGHLDVLYSNAGMSGSVTQIAVGALDLADFDRVMATFFRMIF